MRLVHLLAAPPFLGILVGLALATWVSPSAAGRARSVVRGARCAGRGPAPEALRRLLTPYLRRSSGRLRGAWWQILQAAVAAGVAWYISSELLGHRQPIFAPTAAVVALAANVGGRGRQAVEMLVGVAVGVAVGEALVLVLGTGAVQVTLAAAVAMLAAAALVYTPLPLIQAGASAVIVVALQSPESGEGRVLDALVGAGIALLVSQVLFAPSPRALLTDAGQRTLTPVAGNLRALARALETGDAAAAGKTLARLREDQTSLLGDLDAARETADKVSRRTLRGRREARRAGPLDARLGRIDLLYTSVLLLARAAHRLLEDWTGVPERHARATEALARAVGAVADHPETPDTARDPLREAERLCADRADAATHPRVDLVEEATRLVAADVERMVGGGAGSG